MSKSSFKPLRAGGLGSAKDELAIQQARHVMRRHKTRELKETLASLKHQDSHTHTELLIISALECEIEDRQAFYVATHAPKVGFTLEERAHLA